MSLYFADRNSFQISNVKVKQGIGGGVTKKFIK